MSIFSKKNPIPSSGKKARPRAEQKKKAILGWLVSFRIIDQTTVQVLCDIKSSGAMKTLQGLEKAGFLQVVTARRVPAKIYMLTKAGATEAARFFPPSDNIALPVTHPSRLNTQQLSHDLLAGMYAARLMKGAREGTGIAFVRTNLQTEQSFFIKSKLVKKDGWMYSDADLRRREAIWLEAGGVKTANRPHQLCREQIPDACLSIPSARHVIFLEVQETYPNVKSLRRKLGIYLHEFNRRDDDQSISVIFASTSPAILKFIQGEIDSAREYSKDSSGWGPGYGSYEDVPAKAIMKTVSLADWYHTYYQ